ncbi:ATP-binding cassette domain-containing protein [Halocella sp. SP3-1]|uniref:ABC transporter ATP-binding protein n=1 Tax=Halocella sp. SP3-1 TaxID=2382161 RepID=UPI000F75DD86|nr:ATP-binding cassette domain-containing protein [Halocella sp. SP3-1]AZO94655.1 ATP-binding cassette domain-containing protein [Halocella sp. SP3-1]
MFTFTSVKYKDVLDINKLKIEENKISCIVGKSGSGKTTLLKLLNNMISIDSGSLKYKGKKINKYNPIELRREVLMLPQNPIMFPDTIRDNFTKTLEYSEYNFRDENIYKDLLNKVDLNLSLDTDTQKLSGGEKQRVALARVLLLQPTILLLDEPSSALDENTEEFIVQMVVNYIKKRNGSLIMVTHSKNIADKYGETIISLNNGQIENVENRRS